MKSALIIRHVPVEGIAGYRAPIEAAGYDLDRIDVADPAFGSIDLAEPDLLIMMGGPMAVYEADRYPWIACQQRRLAHRLAADRPTLGVCFGAQLVASALGAEVFPGPAKEVGFHPLTIAETPAAEPLRHLAELPVLHWHGDTFTLPDGAERLASSALYPNQAFRVGPNILGLQFHAEMGLDERFEEWVEQWPHDIAAAGTTAEQLRADHARHGPAVVSAGRAMIAEWLGELT
ncbi:MAG: glutamine amidotransferase [Sphingomonadales bacterium 32-68-7]|nr:MAG: glutamine amidotransferase [Sphingomonadales bacterium 12-68-11]OYX10003.1 MAG: glutamine amidotransferase [Sphingomonadales bacterium 32-68-7]